MPLQVLERPHYTCSLPSIKGKPMNAKLQAAVMSYLRTALSAILGAYIAGQTDPKLLASLALSAVAGPLLRALNPNDASFGRIAK
jgi:hypothetical protein